eukprot:TRINITY_DN46824_c0_g1_i1.p1 TRINITY_DN46824_c0_g1~~TRINITY_DN46824_c0_g1_i1.p1  ORF type:complete len:523 (-),score=101.57 TRINITY_DN46824_c0_g1_i1:350-1918(-)
MRQRARASSPSSTATGQGTNGANGKEVDVDDNGKPRPGASTGDSLLKAASPAEMLARFGFVGIFVVENLLHAFYFEIEVDNMVAPALAPLPREVAVCLHVMHIVFGLFGAVFVLVSSFDTAGRTVLTKGTSMMLVFMCTITWTWWINRQGVPYWKLDEYPFWDLRCSAEKRNRTVHILKNVSILGALTMVQQMAKREMASLPLPPSFLEGLVTALRTWSFSASFAPQLVALAVLRCYLKEQLPSYTAVFMLLLSTMAIQATANLVNSYRDFEKGIDTKESAGDRTLVDGLVSPTMLKGLAAFCLVWWMSFFMWSLWSTEFHSVVLGTAAMGTLIALGYTAGPAPLKYIGLGDAAVFFCFGPGLIAYSSVVLVGSMQWQTLAFSAPVSLYVVATLHANNYRDIETDSRAGIKTVAILLGPPLALHYYTLLLAAAHVGALVAGYMLGCIGVLSTLFVVPQSIWLLIRIRQKALLRTQDEETAKTALSFAVALALGIATMPGSELSWPGLGVSFLAAMVLKFFTD